MKRNLLIGIRNESQSLGGRSPGDGDDVGDDVAAPSLYDAPDGTPDDGRFDDSIDEDGDAAEGRAGRDRAAGRPAPPAAGCWREAVAPCAGALAEASARFARLDERLRIMAPPDRAATRARLATLQACRLLWGVGAVVAPEAVALDALDRRGGAAGDAPAVTAARRLARALTRRPGRLTAHDTSEPAEDDPALCDAPPLVAAGLAAPCGGLSEADRLDAAAARLTAAAGRGRAGRGRAGRGWAGKGWAERDWAGALFAPVPARRRIGGPAPQARLAAFLGDVADGARDALALLDDLAAWRVGADAAAAAMKGPTPARMVALLARRPAVSVPAAASALRLSDDAALRALTRLERDGLAREITGQGRFRVWAARV